MVTMPTKKTTIKKLRKNTYKMGRPGAGRVEEPKKNGDPLAPIYTLLSVGDSAVIQLSCDTLLANLPKEQTQLPPWLKKGKKIIVNMSVVSIKSMDEMQKEMQQKALTQMSTDDKLLQDYFAKNNLKPEKTASGMYYSITTPGKGETAKPGQMVSMNYIGKTLEGKQFDANMDENFKPIPGKEFSFPLGAGRVIKGWDEGVQLLNKGAKANFYIPSPLAYGPQAMGPELPANSVLVFNVEVLDIKEADNNGPGAAPQGAPQAQGGPQGAPHKAPGKTAQPQQAPPKAETK